MKFVMWFCVGLVFSIIKVSLEHFGVFLGGIPMGLILFALFAIAKKLCNIWDKKHNVKKIKEKEPSLIVLIVIGIILFAIVVWCCISK